MRLQKYKLALLICFFFFAENSIVAASKKTAKSDTIILQLKWKHQFQFAGYYAAIEKGFYSKAGLTVKLREADYESKSIRSVISGNAHYGIAASDLLISYNVGKPIVLLANIFQHSPHVFLTLNHDNLDNIHDLAGQSIMLEEHTEELLAYLESEQISTKDLNFVPHTFTPTPLINGEVYAISAYSTDEPFLLRNSGIDYNIFNPRSVGIDFYGDALFTSKDEIEKHPKRVDAFLKASLQGWKYALENEDEIIDLIYSKYSTRHSKEHLKFEAEQMRRIIMPDVIEVGYINPNRWQRIGEIYNDLGMLPENISLDDFIYDRNPAPSYRYIILVILAILVLMFCVSFIALRFFRLNNRLQKESIIREENEVQLKDLNATKDKFFSIIAHDLKGPIGSVAGILSMVEKNEIDLNREMISAMNTTIKNTSKLLDDLLLWSRTQKKSLVASPDALNVLELVNNAIAVYRLAIDEKKLTIDISNVDETVMVYADPQMTDTILRNVINNAIKFTPKFGSLTISSSLVDDMVRVNIADSGIGMSEITVRNLFQIETKPTSNKGTNNESGTGLGLIVCKELIKLNNGKFGVKSSINKGSDFWIELPTHQNKEIHHQD